MEDLIKIYHELCAPAKLYIILSITSTTILLFAAFNRKNPVVNKISILQFFLGACIWTYTLNIICSHGWEMLSWMLVLSPLIITTIAMIVAAIKKY